MKRYMLGQVVTKADGIPGGRDTDSDVVRIYRAPASNGWSFAASK